MQPAQAQTTQHRRTRASPRLGTPSAATARLAARWNVRALSVLELTLGNIGVAGADIYRGHDNVQGANDVGPNPDFLSVYYGLAEGAWKYLARVLDVDY